MKEPASLEESDIGPEATIAKEFQRNYLRKRGYLQFFFHSELTPLPVRDMTNTKGEGHKPEPCIERKAENYCTNCYQSNINAFSKQDRRYLFLYTECRYDGLDEQGDRFIVGYIEKQRALNINGRTAVQGPTKLVEFENACPLGEVAPPNLRGAKKLGEEKTQRVLDYLDEADNVYQECVEKVKELEQAVARPRVWEGEGDSGGVPPPEEDDFDDEVSGGC